MSDFAILLAGTIEATDRLKHRLSGCRVIAADAGIEHAGPLGLTPELWLGDFDSANASPDDGLAVETQSFPADKDATDGDLAIRAAMERGARTIVLVGALGGPRSDHAFAHYVLALRYCQEGYRLELDDGRERGFVLDPGETLNLDLEAGTQFSILKFSDVAGLTIAGAVYPLDDADVPFYSILTQSNEARGQISVRIRSGRAILLAQADPHRH